MLTIVPRQVALRLFAGAFVLVLISIAVHVTAVLMPVHRLFLLVDHLFNVDLEGNIPAWYSSLLLFLCSLSAWLAAASTRLLRHKDSVYWRGLALVFLLFSLDELVMLHEHGNWIMEMVIQPTGIFYYPWVILGLAAVALFVPLYFRFWLGLPARTRNLMFLGALLFFGGALGVEMVSSVVATRYGGDSLARWLMTPVEELLEMSGTILLLYTMLDHMARQPVAALRFGLGTGAAEPAHLGGQGQPVAAAD